MPDPNEGEGEQSRASPLVLAIIQASSLSIAAHFSNFVSRMEHQGVEAANSLRAVAIGYDGDLSDRWDSSDGGFDHSLISGIFQSALDGIKADSRTWLGEFGLSGGGRRAEWGAGSQLDFFIYGQDYDRGLQALLSDSGEGFRRRSQEAEGGNTIPGPLGRTRVSAIVQRSLEISRRVLDPARALRSVRAHEFFRVSVPSPLWIARQILTDPEYPASEAYAEAALRAYLFERIEAAHSLSALDLRYEAISGAYETLLNRQSVSRDLFLGAANPQAMLISQYLAMSGELHLQVRYKPAHPAFSDRFNYLFGDISASDSPLFSVSQRGISVRADPQNNSLPTTSDLVTRLTGLPLPIEGASTIFNGALRLADGGDLVAAVTGTFGAGKTSVCLGIAAALAPLGCRTLFLSCEEKKRDIDSRLREVIPANLIRSTPLLRGVRLFDRQGSEQYPWFLAATLDPSGDELRGAASGYDIADGLIAVLRPILENMDNGSEGLTPDPTRFARLIIIDGIHQLFRGVDAAQSQLEHALSKVVAFCRMHKALFVFTVGEGEREDRRLEYVCDLVIALDRVGFDSSDQQPYRLLKLLKARRQAVRPGAHLFHLTAPRGFRIKPSLAALADDGKGRRWIYPDPNQVLYIAPRAAGSMQSITRYIAKNPLARRLIGFQRFAHTLVKGRGSSGKSALGLSLLHRRPLRALESRRPERTRFLEDSGFSDEHRSFESRVLVVSFLYPPEHYSQFVQRIMHPEQGSAIEGIARYEESGELELNPEDGEIDGPVADDVPIDLLPDSVKQDVLSLYPGHLMPEDFLAKIVRRIRSAELRGLPYTGVLIDGIHNVLLQFPEIERELGVWPQIYTTLRRVGVSAVITHTEFQVSDGDEASSIVGTRFFPGLEEHTALARSAPMLSTLVSAGDYVIEVTPTPTLRARLENGRRIETRYKAVIVGSLNDSIRGRCLLWDRSRCRWYMPTLPLSDLVS